MKLYASYIKEVAGMELEYCEDYFYTFKIDKDSLYLCDVYVKPESRGKSTAEKIIGDVSQKAKELGFGCITSSVCKNIAQQNQERSTHILRKCGFTPYKTDDNMTYYYKEIK